ncbi:transposase [Candidatus Odyssella acanthamoebae]|uniref:Transposase n=1 Tax=Candidatus Odyssella acanthamoebae TaxID=91604 RepID=A0A077AU73_9PROT|nr:transposase [Candidatus Paracaedibacter acanthamoebae]AIK96742.1 hypothetical protein ID47_08430 [Candidatus Paracaedibacter acanthamoebae]
MSGIRRNHSADFKAHVALAAIREDATIAELSVPFGVHSTLIHRWKREALSRMSEIFSGKQAIQEANYINDIKELHAKIGQLTVEKDFLETVSKRLGLLGGKK